MGFPGYIVKEFPPTQDNPRNSEGDFIKLKDGRIAFAYSRFRDGSLDGSTCDLAVSFSSDEGETWSKERIFLTPHNYDGFNLMSVTFSLATTRFRIFMVDKQYLTVIGQAQELHTL